jgi:hypothetical protein
MNRVENLWNELNRTMQGTWPVVPPRNSDELWALVSDVWDEFASYTRYIRLLIKYTARRMKSESKHKFSGLIKEVNF